MDIEQLERLARLRDQGALTEDEFQTQKARLVEGSAITNVALTRQPNLRLLLVAALVVVVVVSVYFAIRSKDVPSLNISAETVKPTKPVVAVAQLKEAVAAPKLLEKVPPTVALEIDGENIPEILRGQWGTNKANCASQDDYGPMLVSSKGFSHYEVTAEAGRILKTKPDTINIEFSSIDSASNESYAFQERWRYDADKDRLVATTYDGGTQTTSYRRC